MIGEQVIDSYLQHVTTNSKSAFFDGTRSQFLAGIVTLGKSFWIFHPNFGKFPAILSSKAIPLGAFK
jgi:hypothetical protein